MPEWCHFYGRPVSEFWDLTVDEYQRMIAYAREYTQSMGTFRG